MANKYLKRLISSILISIMLVTPVTSFAGSKPETRDAATTTDSKHQGTTNEVAAENTTMDTGSAATYLSMAMVVKDERGNSIIWNPNVDISKTGKPQSVLKGEGKTTADCINQSFPTAQVKEFFESVYGAGNCDFSKLHISMIIEVKHKGEEYTYDGTEVSEFATPEEYWAKVDCKEGRLFDTSDPAQLEALMKWASWAKPSDFKTRNDIILYLEKQGIDPEVAKEVAKEVIASTSNCTFSEVYSYSDSGPSIRDVMYYRKKRNAIEKDHLD